MRKNEAYLILGLSGEINTADIKLAYKRKVKQYHPDVNDAGLEMTKLINAAYDLVKGTLCDVVMVDESITDYPEDLSMAINSIINLDGLEIEICGLWVWVGGNTQEHKEILKENQFKWARKKKLWYYRPAQQASRNRTGKSWNMASIRSSYGSEKATAKTYIQIQSA